MATPFVPYNPGTVSVTNGGTAIVGTGTDFMKYSEGDTLVIGGLSGRLAADPPDATHATFALPYAGTTGSGKAYDWLPAAEVTKALTLYASFQRLLVGGNLAAFAALDGTGGDMFPRFTGAGTMDLRTEAQLLADIGAGDALKYVVQSLSAAQQGQARANIGGGDMAGHVDLLINGMGQVNQRVYTTVADGGYWCDRHYVLSQTAAITPTLLADVANGLPSMMRLSQSQASAQRMGNAQVVEGMLSKAMRGRKATLGGRLRCSSAQAIRFAVLEWTGTEDAPVIDVVNSWTNSTFTAGQFFKSTTMVVAGVGTITPSANVLTDFGLVVDVSAACKNLIVFIWTEGTAAQNVNLDFVWSLLPGDWTAAVWPYVRPRHPQTEVALCQRYYETSGAGAVLEFSGNVTSGSVYYARQRFAVQKRVAATVVFTNAAASNFSTTPATPGGLIDGISEARTATGTGTGRYVTAWTADAEFYGS